MSDVRNARAQDAPAIAAIANHYIRETIVTFNEVEKTAADFVAIIAARQSGGQAFLVAQDAGKVIGFATYFAFRSGSGYRHTVEHSVLLHPEATGRGQGSALTVSYTHLTLPTNREV